MTVVANGCFVSAFVVWPVLVNGGVKSGLNHLDRVLAFSQDKNLLHDRIDFDVNR